VNLARRTRFERKRELFCAIDAENVQLLSFVMGDLKGAAPIRANVLRDRNSADSGLREGGCRLGLVIELSLTGRIPMVFADDVAGGDEPMGLVFTGKLEVEDCHSYLQTGYMEIAEGELRLRSAPHL
jgi:hypothetical protein